MILNNNESSSLILKYAPFEFIYENLAGARFLDSLEIEIEFNSKENLCQIESKVELITKKNPI